MAAGNELEDNISARILSPREAKLSSTVQPLEVPSSEDAAWADSLLTEDPKISEICWSSWASLKDALSETVIDEHDSQVAMLDNSLVDGFQISPRVNPMISSESLGTRLDDALRVIEEAEDGTEELLSDENTNVPWSKRKLRNVFRPTYSEDIKDSGTTDKEEELSFSSLAMNEPPEDIFQVWDLGFPAEEDELITQLNKALDESSSDPSPLGSSSNVVSKDFIDIGMDDIVSGMADLSLNRFA